MTKRQMKVSAAIVLTLLVLTATIFIVDNNLRPSEGVSRPLSELAALSAAIETYKQDHGKYPNDPATTEELRTNVESDSVTYIPASAFLYRVLSARRAGTQGSPNAASIDGYFDFKLGMLKKTNAGVIYIADAWGNSIGYSTYKSAHPDSPDGNNSTFDLWSTGGPARETDKRRWVRNW